LYEIQYLTAYISGNMLPRQRSQADSNNSYFKLLLLLVQFELLVFWLLSLKVGQNPDLPKSKNSIITKIKLILGLKSKKNLYLFGV
jgi:hypothetical protein